METFDNYCYNIENYPIRRILMMKRTFHCIIVCTLIILSTLHISKNVTIIYDNNYNMSLFSDDLNNKSVIE